MLEILSLKMASIWKVAMKQWEGRRKVKNGFSITVPHVPGDGMGNTVFTP